MDPKDGAVNLFAFVFILRECSDLFIRVTSLSVVCLIILFNRPAYPMICVVSSAYVIVCSFL